MDLMSPSLHIALTREQERYADERGATSYVNCHEGAAVCLYDERPDKTIRWIVDPTGRLLERTEFDRV